MFDSGILAADLINDLQGEVDIAIPISNRSYVMWLGALEQLLYTEFIREQGCTEVLQPSGGTIDLSALSVSTEQERIRYEDVFTVYADSVQLIESTLTSGQLFPNTYFKQGEKLGYHVNKEPGRIKICYYAKPKQKTVSRSDEIGPGNVMVPIEFMDLVAAKLRGEAYKVANEDSIAAKWIGDYNMLLESFKAWCSLRTPQFGM